jgi:hypothetical protein
MDGYIATKLVVTADQLRDIFGEDDAPTGSCVQTCEGEWRLETDGGWRFFRQDDN